MNRTTYAIIAIVLLAIGEAFAIAMLVGVNRHLAQKETANEVGRVCNCN